MLAVGRAVSTAGDLAALIALLLRLRPEGSGWVAALLAAQLIPVVLLAPVAGLVVDRFENRRVLVIALTGQAVAAVPPALVSSPAATVGLFAGLYAFSVFVGPATSALVPAITGEHEVSSGLLAVGHRQQSRRRPWPSGRRSDHRHSRGHHRCTARRGQLRGAGRRRRPGPDSTPTVERRGTPARVARYGRRLRGGMALPSVASRPRRHCDCDHLRGGRQRLRTFPVHQSARCKLHPVRPVLDHLGRGRADRRCRYCLDSLSTPRRQPLPWETC